MPPTTVVPAPPPVKINKWLDLLDRVGWTALQAAVGAAFVVFQTNDVDWGDAAKMVGVATLIAVVKVVLAQRAGDDDLGAAVPGQVIQQ